MAFYIIGYDDIWHQNHKMMWTCYRPFINNPPGRVGKLGRVPLLGYYWGEGQFLVCCVGPPFGSLKKIEFCPLTIQEIFAPIKNWRNHAKKLRHIFSYTSERNTLPFSPNGWIMDDPGTSFSNQLLMWVNWPKDRSYFLYYMGNLLHKSTWLLLQESEITKMR